MPLANKVNEKFTYQDYLNWSDDERWEIIGGVPYNMSPAPTPKHQKIGWHLKSVFITQKQKIKSCTPFDAPTDVVFDDFNVVQPDIFIVCDKNKITETNIQGAPDLIIEILSKTTAYKDTKIKRDLYEKYGVKEYIIIYPELEILERFMLKRGKYGSPERFNWDEVFKFKTFNIKVNLWEVFEKERND